MAEVITPSTDVVSEAASILEARGYTVELERSRSSTTDLCLRVEPPVGRRGTLVVVDFKHSTNGSYLPSSVIASGVKELVSLAVTQGHYDRVVRVLSTNLGVGESGSRLIRQLNQTADEPVALVPNISSGRELASAILEHMQ